MTDENSIPVEQWGGERKSCVCLRGILSVLAIVAGL